MTGSINNPHLVTLFGGTGDLTYRKLLPAFLNLHLRDELDQNFKIVVIGRRDFTNDSYHDTLKKWLNTYARLQATEAQLSAFLNRITYFKMVFTESEGYSRLSDYFKSLDPKDTYKKLYYFAVDPSYFIGIAEKLDQYKLTQNSNIIIEKPFGNDKDTSDQINERLVSIFKDDHIFRIDHYLAKEVVQNILPIRKNPLFTDRWDRDHIKSIEISIFEEVGVESRGAFYDVTGALKDMVHSHLLQVLSLLLLDDINIENSEALHKAQSDALSKLYLNNADSDIIYGQYEGYTNELNVSERSTTDTYVALRLASHDPKWKDVPFYIQTGKSLKNRIGIIAITFNNDESLVMELQPKETIVLTLSNKDTINLKPYDICGDIDYEAPEAYERLLLEALNQNPTLFVSNDQVHLCWSLVEDIIERTSPHKIHLYKPYSDGPKEKHTLTEENNDMWYL